MAKKKQSAEISTEQADSAKTQLIPQKRRALMLRNCEPFCSAITLMDMPDAEPPLENGYRLKYADDDMRIWLHGDALFVQIEHKVSGRWTVTECYQ